jgi:putative hemolysin
MQSYPQIKFVNATTVYGQWINRLLDRWFTPLLRLRPFQMAYSRAKNDPKCCDLWTKVLQELNTTLYITPNDLARIPKTGGVIIVANHPHGIMDGVLLGSLMHRVRDDFKIVMNEATSMPGLEEGLIFVSIFGSSQENARKNAHTMREILGWLKAGHAIVIFPAGEISAIKNFHEKIAVDNTWSTNIIRFSERTKAPILPLFIEGQNDNVFLKLGLIHPLFRTLQIGRVTNHLFGKTMTVRSANPINSKLLEGFKNERIKTDFIRANLYALMSRQSQQMRELDVPLTEVLKTNIASTQIQAVFELLEVHDHIKICENSVYTVLFFNQQQLLDLGNAYASTFSLLKDEIGRLRELTFREIGEGSGKLRDLDQFDEYYYHLTLWDRQQKQLIGAYRVAFTEDVFPLYGVQGLYTALQFDYQPTFFTSIGPAMELSRAFIIKAHQKNHMGLSTLLNALSHMLVLRPHIQTFFGAVSISNEFQSISKKLIIDFLAKYHGQSLSSLVSAKHPPQLATYLPESEWQLLINTVQDLSLLNTVVSNIEEDGKEIPPLIAVYLSLMGSFIAFDHDTGFNSIDGLLVMNMIDAAKKNNPIMRRLMGKQNFDIYRSGAL